MRRRWSPARNLPTLLAGVLDALLRAHTRLRAARAYAATSKQSISKSVVLCHAKGADAVRILKKLKVFKDQLPHLAFMQHGEQILIPPRKTHQYLGTVISYRDAQEKTVQLRIRKARGQYSQLRKAINSRRVTHNRPRYQIWRAGVWSSAAHGLLAVGVRSTGRKHLRAMAARQMRAIAERPAHQICPW